MRHVLIVLLLSLGLSLPASAQSAQVESTISSQIDAFRADDFPRAFTYASPMIQGIFGNPGNFGVMVRNGYPMVHRPAEVRYLDLREIAGRLYQKVQITDAQGRVHLLDYEMIEVGGAWKINGVTLLEAPGAGA